MTTDISSSFITSKFQGQSERTRAPIEMRSYEVIKSILKNMSSFRENVETHIPHVHEDKFNRTQMFYQLHTLNLANSSFHEL